VLDGRFVWYLLAALLVSCTVGAGLAFWAANAYIVSQHTGDPPANTGRPQAVAGRWTEIGPHYAGSEQSVAG
jgi:hypothetical protein